MKLNRIFGVAFALLCVVACNKNKSGLTQHSVCPINVTAAMDIPTRAGYDAENLPDNFYLTVIQDLNDPESEYNYTLLEMVKGEGNGYYCNYTELLWNSNDHANAQVNAYSSKGFTKVLADQSSVEKLEASDLLGAYLGYVNPDDPSDKDVTLTGDNLHIRFRHLLCKLDVTFVWDEAFGNLPKELTSVVYSGFGEDVTLDYDCAEVSAGENTTDILAYLTAADDNKIYVSEAIFAPQVSDMAIRVTARVEGEVKEYQLTLNPPTGGFVPGNAYTMNVKICRDALLFKAAPTLTGWEDGEQLDFNRAEEMVYTFTASTDGYVE